MPREKYTLGIAFECLQGDVERSVSAVMEEIEVIRKNGIQNAMVKNIKAIELHNVVENKKSLDFWRNYLIMQVENETDLSEVESRPRLVHKLTGASFKHSVRRYLSDGCFRRFVLMPAK
jgi:hypothetical protein